MRTSIPSSMLCNPMVLPSNLMEGNTVFHLSVANGMRQGGILSPILFTVYIDELLQRLTNIGVGCHWKGMFAGCLCYADDLALLASFAHALRRINVDSLFWFCYGEKPDVQCRKDPINLFSSSQIHCGWWLHRILLNFSDSVCHMLSCDLSDIEMKTKEFIQCANFLRGCLALALLALYRN